MRSNGTLIYSEDGSHDELEIVDCSPIRGQEDRPPSVTRCPSARERPSERHSHQYSEGNSISSEPNIDRIVRKSEKVHKKREWLNEQSSLLSCPPYAYDYWTLPRHSDWLRRSQDIVEYRYPTPGGVLFTKKHHGRLSGRKSHKHKSARDSRPPLPHEHSHSFKRSRESIRSSLDDMRLTTEDKPVPHRSELKVYFRFSKGTMGETLDLDYRENEPFLLALQAHCRGYLAKKTLEKKIEEDNAVRVIQRNCERIFNPWVRLMMSLRPMLKSNRIDEELMYLRSELERYKTLVKMLRFENAEYQAKVANLLHLIEQINTKGSSSTVVNDLITQISEALTKNQEFWQEMAANNQALQSAVLPRPALNGLRDGSPITPNSPMTRLRNDADFYRNQVEVLKEEADEQQHRSSEHFQGQVSVLTNRMEHLQHLLTMECSKGERLSAELEELNNTLTASRNYERSLEHMVSQLSKQLEEKNKAATVQASEATPSSKARENGDQSRDLDQSALEKELNAYRHLVSELRSHLSTHPKAKSILADTQFQPGGTFDLFQDPPFQTHSLITLDPAVQQQSFAKPGHTDDEKTDTQRSEEITELKRQLVSATNNLRDFEERVRNEVEDREIVENENRQLHTRVAALDRELRCVRDEFEEALNRRDLLHQRELKELTDQLEEEARKTARLTQQNRELDRELVELRNSNDVDESILNDEWESVKSRLKSDIAHYKRALDALQEEFDQYRQDHDTKEADRLVAERDERINLLEREQQQWRVELDIQQVKLQNATNLLEDAEKRLKQAMREKTAQAHRVTQLESERDAAIREAATISGRASAEKEHIGAKLREYEEMKAERDALRRELSEVKQTLAGCTAESAAEKRQAQARLKDLTAHQEIRVADLKAELERTREEMERLQAELQTVQASEAENKSAKQQSRWRINELEDQLSHALRRISALERHNADLDAELVRAKADLSASREAASLLRASRTRVADEWLPESVTGDDTEDEDANKSLTMNASGLDGLSEDSMGTPVVRRARLGGGAFRSSSLYRSNPALYRSLGGTNRSLSATDRSSFRQSSSNILDSIDKSITSNGIDHSKDGQKRTTIVREGQSDPSTEAPIGNST